jgi:hypothetical protein
MIKKICKYIAELLTFQRRDFSVFVSSASKYEKERVLKQAADRAIEQQRQIIETAATA